MTARMRDAGFVDLGVLPRRQARVVRRIAEVAISGNPDVFGLLIHGSFRDKSHRLPGSDIDIYFFGEPPVRKTNEFNPLVEGAVLEGGVLMEFAPFFWGDIHKPETLWLPTVISLARGHVIWEEDGILSAARRRAKALLCDGDWVSEKIDQMLQLFFAFLVQWSNPAVPAQPVRKDWDFARHALMHVSGIANSVVMAPTSFSRRALFDIFAQGRVLGLPVLGEATALSVGMHDLADGEVMYWLERIRCAYSHVRLSRPDITLFKARYYIKGVQAMARRGCARAGMWPLWRAAQECVQLLKGADDEHEEHCRICMLELAGRLRLREVPDLLEKARELRRVFEMFCESRRGFGDLLTAKARACF